LRGLGLTVAEIRELAVIYLGRPGEPIGPHVAGLLRRARDRADTRIAELQGLRRRIATPWYAPSLAFTSDAALIFYGASMLLAAARGYAGCEVLAVTNWLLRRDDQVGCVLFAPVDALERRP